MQYDHACLHNELKSGGEGRGGGGGGGGGGEEAAAAAAEEEAEEGSLQVFVTSPP